MENETVKFDNETPMVMEAAKVRSVMGIDSETGLVGNVAFDLFVNEAGKRVGDAVKIVGDVLPTLGDANKRYSFTTGSAGRTLTWTNPVNSQVVPFSFGANKQCSAFWDGVTKVWTKEDEVELPKGVDGNQILPLWVSGYPNGYLAKSIVQDSQGISYESLIDGNTYQLTNEMYWKKTTAAATSAKIDVAIEDSNNVFDNNTMLANAYSPTTGVPNTSLNWIRTPIKRIKDGATHVSINGAGLCPTSGARFLFWKEDKTFLSAVMSTSGTATSQSTQKPTEAYYYAINVANLADIGNNPTNSAFKDTFIISYTPTPIPYEKYGGVINAAEIKGVIPEVVYNQQFTPVVEDVDELKDKTRIIEKIEITPINKADKSKIIVGYSPSFGNGNIVVSANARMLIIPLTKRDTDYAIVGVLTNSIHIYNNVVDPNNLNSFTGSNRVQIVGDNGSNKTEYEFNSGGNGYYLVARIHASNDSANDTVMVYEGTLNDNIPYSPYFEPYFKESIDYTHIINVPEPNETITKDLYYSFNKVGGETGNGRMTVYSKMKDNYYAGFNIDHVINPSKRTDLWRIRDSYVYRLIDGVMILQSGNQLLLANENEYVYFITGASDSTGGFHGNEELTFIQFYANSLPIDISSNISLTSCEDFYYRQISKTYNPEDVSLTPENVATHVKITSFYDGCYDTNNNITLHKSVSLGQAGNGIYGGLSCIHINAGNVAYSNYSDNIVAVQDNAQKLNQSGELDPEGTICYYNSSTKLSVKCTSYWKIVKQNNVDVTKAFSASSKVTLWDRPTDFKYYHRVTSSTPFIVNDIISSRMVVKFSTSK